MKNLLCLLLISSIVGCASTSVPVKEDTTPKTYKLQNYKGPEAMDSNEVVQASKQCIFAKMRPNVSYLSVRTDQGKVAVPVSVNCEPF